MKIEKRKEYVGYLACAECGTVIAVNIDPVKEDFDLIECCGLDGTACVGSDVIQEHFPKLELSMPNLGEKLKINTPQLTTEDILNTFRF